MRVLLDTNIALRVFDSTSEAADLNAILHRLRATGRVPTIAPQVLYEAYVVLTREPQQNGWGLDSSAAIKALRSYQSACDLLPDPDGLTETWMQVCEAFNVRGKQAHDARLVAFMNLHGITELLTLNPGDFGRYDGIHIIGA